ncbi:serine threonine protein kinase [Stemphylium lycopersici]|uniref:non-specific serine/threonine protein kinase n=1 Tax=Stemphylium lycopersici TaxID=183478 RepID=A0A364MRG5_STELY|nr:serine threonine protein kinase [Stemphylium lycopersici]RAR00258.1 serine threonine protein kinase [Stemphylium lycopersici]
MPPKTSQKNRNVPPWKSAKPYLRHDARAFLDANGLDWTAKTILLGDAATRGHYEARVGNPNLPGLPPGRNIIPAHPYLQQDINHAKTHGTLPARRDAAGNPIVPASVAPVPTVPTSTVPLPVANLSAALAPKSPELTAPAQQGNNYPYDFWPQQPWHSDPNDRTEHATLAEISENRNVWLGTKPYQWPERDEENMHGARFLGAGAYGCAGVWCQVNETNMIERKFVIKEAKATRHQWRDPLQWRDRLPREIRTHQIVDSGRADAVPDHGNLARHQGYRLMMRQRRYWLYLDYYEGGDLSQALKHLANDEMKARYTQPRKKGAAPPEGHDWDKGFRCYRVNGKLPQVIPERLIYEIVISLVTACQILHFGQTDNSKAAPGAHQVTHLDIKADNIFIQPSNQDGELPKFFLSDFGLAFFDHNRHDQKIPDTERAPSDNPGEYVWLDSSKWDARYAPEYYEIVQREMPRPLGEKTDVWQIGAVLFWLLTNGTAESRFGPKCLYKGNLLNISIDINIGKVFDNATGQNQFCDKTYPTLRRYTSDLVNACAQCLNYDPEDRLDLASLRAKLERYLADLEEEGDDGDMSMLNVSREKDFVFGGLWPGHPID